MHGVTPATAFVKGKERFLIFFNHTTGDLITGDKFQQGTVTNFLATNKWGSKANIAKWSK